MFSNKTISRRRFIAGGRLFITPLTIREITFVGFMAYYNVPVHPLYSLPLFLFQILSSEVSSASSFVSNNVVHSEKIADLHLETAACMLAQKKGMCA